MTVAEYVEIVRDILLGVAAIAVILASLKVYRLVKKIERFEEKVEDTGRSVSAAAEMILQMRPVRFILRFLIRRRKHR